MSLYEAAKDAVKLAQKADNIELIQKLLDVQKMALDMQEKQQLLQSRITGIEKENSELKEVRKYDFAPGYNYLIDPDDPNRRLCPVCTKRLKTAVPLHFNGYCFQCKAYYS